MSQQQGNKPKFDPNESLGSFETFIKNCTFSNVEIQPKPVGPYNGGPVYYGWIGHPSQSLIHQVPAEVMERHFAEKTASKNAKLTEEVAQLYRENTKLNLDNSELLASLVDARRERDEAANLCNTNGAKVLDLRRQLESANGKAETYRKAYQKLKSLTDGFRRAFRQFADACEVCGIGLPE